MTTPLPPPTMADVVDMAVWAMNRVIIHGLDLRRAGDTRLTEDRWNRIVEADYLINTVQDAYADDLEGQLSEL